MNEDTINQPLSPSVENLKTEVLKNILEVRKEVKYVMKSGVNESQGYKYLGEAQIVELIKPLMDKHGLIFLFSARTVQARPSVSKKHIVDEIVVDYKFVDAETGHYVDGVCPGFGADSGDKGVYKAITGAIKYIFMKTFLIPTGDDPEEERSKKQSESKKTHLDKDAGDPLEETNDIEL